MKFPTNEGTGEVEGDQDAARDYYVTELRQHRWRDNGKNAETTLCVKSKDA